MSPIAVISVIIVAIFVLVAMAYINNAMEAARLAKARKLAVLTERLRYIEYILCDLPATFLNKGIGDFIQKEKMYTLSTLLQLASDEKRIDLEKRVEEVNQQQVNSNQEPAAKINEKILSQAQAAEIQNLLGEAHKLLVISSKERRIGKTKAQQLSKTIKHLTLVSNYEFLKNSATKARQDGNLKLAISFYIRASGDLSKHNQDGKYNTQVTKLRALIKNLQEQEAEERELAGPDTAANTENTLSEQVSELSAEDDEWKKKNVYD